MAKTIDTIVEEVTRALAETEAGRKQVRAMDTLVERLNQTAESLRQKRASLRTRSGISFSVNTTQAQGDPLKISARVSGVDCGVVVFEQAKRIFWPSSNFTRQWHSDKKICDQKALAWGEPAVARFIKACGSEADVRKYDGRESSVQEWLFRAMKGDGRKKTQLRHFQPVLFGGVPIQIPLPVTPRGRSGSAERGKHKGHSDVLARSRRHGQLVVFEVKRPGAGRAESLGALEQAVRYAASLDHLMSRAEHRAAYWRLFRSRRGKDHLPRFSAIAFVDEAGGASEKQLAEERDNLLLGNARRYDLRVMLYRRLGKSMDTREIP